MLLRSFFAFTTFAFVLGERLPRQDQCVPEDNWPIGPGQPLVPQAPDAELQDMLSQISADRVQAIIEKLVSFGTRNTLSSQTDPNRGIGAARDWIASEMRSFGGRLNVTVPSYVQAPTGGISNSTVISNIVATLPGSDGSNRVYVVSGHYDSRNSDNLDIIKDAPGANDDASGVAVSMELARVMANKTPRATMIFAAVAGEEQGLFGSTFLAQTLLDAGADVQGMYTNDIVGSSVGDQGQSDPFTIRLFAQGVPSNEAAATTATRLSIGGENDSPARELGRFTNEVASNSATEMNVEVIYRLDRFLRGGDHRPFLERGFTAARFSEPNENFAHQHQDVRIVNGQQFGDLIEFVDFEFIKRVAKVNAAAMWSLANAPGTPKSVTMDESVLTNNSTLFWTAESGGTQYEIVWRNTHSPFWTHVIPVGAVARTTVLLSKDNTLFGVRAVGTNGYRSPATFPFPH